MPKIPLIAQFLNLSKVQFDIKDRVIKLNP